MVKDLYRYIWKVSARDQVFLSLLAVALFLIELVPLELQRRIVNGAVEGRGFELVGWLCVTYAAVALLHGGLKLAMNVYRGSVSEAANKRLRTQMNPPDAAGSSGSSCRICARRSACSTGSAFISELSRMNDPWNDLVDFFRNLTNTGLKFRMITAELDKQPISASRKTPG